MIVALETSKPFIQITDHNCATRKLSLRIDFQKLESSAKKNSFTYNT